MNQAAFHILLGLSHGPLHGYGILKEIEMLSNGQFRLGPGTLYDNLPRLIAKGWITDLGADDSAPDPRRKYELAPVGIEVLRAELDRLGSVLQIGKRRLQRLGSLRNA